MLIERPEEAVNKRRGRWGETGKAVRGLLIMLFFLGICDQASADCPEEMAQIAGRFIRLFASGSLSVNEAKRLIGVDIPVESHGVHWQIKSDGCKAEIVIRAEGKDESADEAELRLRLESGLVLGDLERSLGPWRPVFASKTSSVSFRVDDRPHRPTLVFARLFTPSPSPDSPVLSVMLRRDDGTQNQGAR